MSEQRELSEQQNSRLLVVFEGLGSAHFAVNVENVTPMQLLALAAYLDFQGKQGLLEQKYLAQKQSLEEQEQKPKILVPKMEVDLRRNG